MRVDRGNKKCFFLPPWEQICIHTSQRPTRTAALANHRAAFGRSPIFWRRWRKQQKKHFSKFRGKQHEATSEYANTKKFHILLGKRRALIGFVAKKTFTANLNHRKQHRWIQAKGSQKVKNPDNHNYTSAPIAHVIMPEKKENKLRCVWWMPC